MKTILIMIAVLAGQANGIVVPPLNLEQKGALRCATAFALVNALQEQGGTQALPPLARRGNEFFVRTLAQLMDETGASREQIKQLVEHEAETLTPTVLDEVMPACLLMLDVSGF